MTHRELRDRGLCGAGCGKSSVTARCASCAATLARRRLITRSDVAMPGARRTYGRAPATLDEIAAALGICDGEQVRKIQERALMKVAAGLRDDRATALRGLAALACAA